MIFPRPLRRGGKIGICTPAGPVVEERLRTAVAALQAEGFDVETSPSAFDKYGLFSAPDEIRRRELEELFAREDIDAIISARGGVGSSRLLDVMDTALIARSRKPFLAFSDVTALQLLLMKRERFVTFSGPLAVEWDGAASDVSRKQAIQTLMGEAPSDLIGDIPHAALETLRGAGEVHGSLIPANLSMLTTLLGTPFLPDLRGALLMIEDVNEPPHRVDRMLFHLRNAGALANLGALLLGDFGTEDDSLRSEALRTSVLDATYGTDYPIVANFPFGHGPERMTLPVGASVTLDVKHTSLSLNPVPAELV